MRRNIKRCTNRIGFTYESLSFGNVVVREPNPVDQFYFERTKSADDGCECIAYTDPIRMLFNQQRLSSIGSMAVENWLDSLKNLKNDPLAELRKKCSDSDLKQLIKSRHIQQPSEIMAYAKYCQDNMTEFESEVSKLVAARQAEEDAKKTKESVNVEPPKSE